MFNELLINAPTTVKAVPIYLYEKLSDLTFSAFEKNWIYPALDNEPEILAIPDETGAISKILVKIDANEKMFSLGNFYSKAPKGVYYIADENLSLEAQRQLLLGFALGAYQYNEFKKAKQTHVQIVFPTELDHIKLANEIEAHYITRTLINRPANNLNPETLTQYVQKLFAAQNCDIKVIQDEKLLEQNFPLIYHVGHGSEFSPRLIEVNYGSKDDPKLTIIGKGVTFDSGGLDIKPSGAMRLMKKDMGGAAHALALAHWIIKEKWPVNLQLLLPIVENSISSTAMRPGDIIQSRSGITVEIDNTDAEGRLILADAISYATERDPDTIINFATLTGAARVALGSEVPALFSNNDQLAFNLVNCSQKQTDDMWRLPLHKPYNELIESKFADILNTSTQPFGGAITAALFLTHFLSDNIPLAHIDVMAWNVRNRKGRPVGGEAMGLRATYYGLAQHFEIDQ